MYKILSKKKFDLIFSLGEACSCSYILRKLYLQTASYPFDWIFGSTFINRCQILSDEFKDFIKKEDLILMDGISNTNCNIYYNKLNNLGFNHDFYLNQPFDDAYFQVHEKYHRRIHRVLEKIDKAEKVLLVYLETPILEHTNIETKEILKGFKLLQNKFGKKIHLIYFKHQKDTFLIEKFENEHLIKITCDYKKHESDLDYEVNQKKIKYFLNNFELRLPLGYKFKKNIIKFLINLIPCKAQKHKLRKKYHL